MPPASFFQREPSLYIHRRVLDRAPYTHAQNAFIRSLGNPKIFKKRNFADATVTLINELDIRFASRHSAAIRAMSSTTLRSYCMSGLPETHSKILQVETADIKVLGKHRHLAVLLSSYELEEERAALVDRLSRLAGVAMLPREEPCHISFGASDRELPARAIKALEENLPNAFYVGAISCA